MHRRRVAARRGVLIVQIIDCRDRDFATVSRPDYSSSNRRQSTISHLLSQSLQSRQRRASQFDDLARLWNRYAYVNAIRTPLFTLEEYTWIRSSHQMNGN